jgi:isochorismatase family protein
MKRLIPLLCSILFTASLVSAASTTEKADKAIIIIDMQNDFVEPDGVLCVAGAKPTIPAIQNLVKYGRDNGWKIIYIIREHRPSGLDVDEPRVPLFTDGKPGYCVPGTWGAEIVKGLEPEKDDLVVAKFRNSAFFNTQLDLILRRLGVNTVILAGTQYPNCVRGTANDAMSYNYETVVCTDACSAKTPEVAQANIYDMRNMGIECISLDELKKQYK